MKFQKDNSEVAFTQKMKDDIVAKKVAIAEVKKKYEDKIKEQNTIVDERAILLTPVVARVKQYGLITEQLDKIWHDIDEGRIQADKTSANSWYMSIKAVKDNNPVVANWNDKMYKLTANNV